MKTYTLNRVIRVIKSCKTAEQLRVADKYAELAVRKFGGSYLNQLYLDISFLEVKLNKLNIMMTETQSMMEHPNEL